MVTQKKVGSFNTIGKNGVSFFKNKLRQKNKIASRKTINSIGFKIVYGFNEIRIQYFAEKSWFYILWGRKPGGKFPPKEEIKQWMKFKRIKPTGGISENSLLFLIRRKIAREGIRKTNLYAGQQSFFNAQVRSKLEKPIGDDLKEELFQEMKKNTNTVNA